MNLSLGLKTDPIETRYSFPWLFDLMAEEGTRYAQVGSFFEMYQLERDWFEWLKGEAAARGIVLKSVFTAHRELGGFFVDDPYFERACRRMIERLIDAGAWLGVDHVGWNPGAVHRDRPETKAAGLERFHRHLRELMAYAKERGLKALCLEPMSCLSEPPSTPEEIEAMMRRAADWQAAHAAATVPVHLCGDISHGVADASRRVVHDNWGLFSMQAPWMAEFHFKNTDAIFNSTFGFSEEERARGVVDLARLRELIAKRADAFPVDPLVGYLEIGGPKVGRDYSDPELGKALRASLRAIKEAFDGMLA